MAKTDAKILNTLQQTFADQIDFMERNIGIPNPDEPYIIPFRESYRIPVTGMPMGHRLMQVLNDSFTKHGIPMPRHNNQCTFYPEERFGGPCVTIHHTVAKHPAFEAAITSPSCCLAIQEALIPREDDKQIIDRHRAIHTEMQKFQKILRMPI